VTVRWGEVVAVISPAAAVAAGTVPWGVAVVGAVAWALVYICRWVVLGLLGWKALDKTTADRVPDVLAAVADTTPPPAASVSGQKT